MKIVWNAFNGRYSDNPRALYEALRARGGGEEHVWLADPRHAAAFPPGTVTVPIGTPAAVAALESADVVVVNSHVQLDRWTKKPGATYLQTWHGTPLKRIHRDAAWLPPDELLAELDEDIARWDLLITPSPAATDLLRSAFRYTGEVLETGYPRNDVLSAPDADARRARVRAQLGIPEGTTAVLYAPTYRDDEADGAVDAPLGLDVAALAERLGDDAVLLLRLHYFMGHQTRPASSGRVQDVSAYPDISELYLAADVLVTDYSSSMFDFAVTGKPIVLFTYDLEHYEGRLRGFTFDLRTGAPGPVVLDQEALTEALLDLPAVAAAHADDQARFVARWCALEDGHASERVVAAVWPR
ncbi:CDP-glycerol glycerophosphotransferase family protein [Modestobacter muralis]|uniref:CDP-glycerol glycerophosphotransferase family protein n=1 Tax=Modestobacter muralis TaxID=1608614 RepID=A0A6P0EP39_9ACTN|nr:CDP-glycerol glycerophosphotransferase family protein [Modestobacter muralis]NEK93481.1 CDP-glycerol glycerophosphotransferase family protein [Modestobacter muralis]NEN50248.1 CDP-glycerol glycerophosphotransferase family protein [Modestobacter muralis]